MDGLSFKLKPSSRRNTLQITADRGGELLLSMPPDVAEERLRALVLEKRFRIYTKLAEKDRLTRAAPTKQFVDGEGLFYLGRSHRLRLVEDQDVSLKLLNDRFLLRRDLVASARVCEVQWYSARAKAWLWGKTQEYLARTEVWPVGVKVQDLGCR